MSRLVDLEVRYTYLERTVRELDEVVVELRAEVEALRRQVRVLEDAQRAEPRELPASEKPPHY